MAYVCLRCNTDLLTPLEHFSNYVTGVNSMYDNLVERLEVSAGGEPIGLTDVMNQASFLAEKYDEFLEVFRGLDSEVSVIDAELLTMLDGEGVIRIGLEESHVVKQTERDRKNVDRELSHRRLSTLTTTPVYVTEPVQKCELVCRDCTTPEDEIIWGIGKSSVERGL